MSNARLNPIELSDADDPGLVFWPVGLGDRSLADHFEIARVGGFDSLAITAKRIKTLLHSGTTPRELLVQAADKGLKFGPLDGIATWVTRWRSTQGDATLRNMMTDVFDIEMREALDLAAALDIDAAVAVGFFDEGSVPLPEIIEGFASFCGEARGHAIAVALEPIPFWGIPDVNLAWDIVRQSEDDQASIMIDTWHVQKGSKDFSADLALLESLPGNRIQHVQLADALRQPLADTLAGDVLFRRFPGEGELAVAEILSIVMKTGLVSIGPEIVSAEQSAMDNTEIGRRSGRTTRAVIAKARDRLKGFAMSDSSL